LKVVQAEHLVAALGQLMVASAVVPLEQECHQVALVAVRRLEAHMQY